MLQLWGTSHPLSNHLLTAGTILPLKTKPLSKPVPTEASPEGPWSWCSFEVREGRAFFGSYLVFYSLSGGGGVFSVWEYICVCKYIKTGLKFLIVFLLSLMCIKVCSGFWATSQRTVLITACLMTQACFNRPGTAQVAGRGHLRLPPHQDDSPPVNDRKIRTKHQKCVCCTGQNIPRATLSLRGTVSCFLTLGFSRAGWPWPWLVSQYGWFYKI